MSWLFGVKSVQPIVPPAAPGVSGVPGAQGGPGAPAVKEENTPKGVETQYRFDSAALERAAKAARDLESTKNSKEILELTRAQEKTKQMEYEKQIAEFHAHQEEIKMRQAQMLAEERRKLLDEETKHTNEVLKNNTITCIFLF